MKAWTKRRWKLPAQPWEFRSAGMATTHCNDRRCHDECDSRCRDLYHGINEVRQTVPQQQQCKRWNLRVWTCTKVGLESGDKVVAIDGKPLVRFEELLSSRVLFGATLIVERNGRTHDIRIPDNFYKQTMQAGKKFHYSLSGRSVRWQHREWKTCGCCRTNRVITFTRSMEFVPSQWRAAVK